MDLIFWRHAEAQEPQPGDEDLLRPLTPRGVRQAKRMASWLDRQLPEATRIWVSPARRTEQTATSLQRPYKLRPELAPGADMEAFMQLLQWPQAKTPLLVIGHQPLLGQALSRLLGLQDSECPIRKGSVWWLRSRVRLGSIQAVVQTVQSPEML